MEYEPHYFSDNFEDIDEDFMTFYKEYKFEDVFKEKLWDYIALLGSKITNILYFEIFLDLINKDKVGDQMKN